MKNGSSKFLRPALATAASLLLTANSALALGSGGAGGVGTGSGGVGTGGGVGVSGGGGGGHSGGGAAFSGGGHAGGVSVGSGGAHFSGPAAGGVHSFSSPSFNTGLRSGGTLSPITPGQVSPRYLPGGYGVGGGQQGARLGGGQYGARLSPSVARPARSYAASPYSTGSGYARPAAVARPNAWTDAPAARGGTLGNGYARSGSFARQHYRDVSAYDDNRGYGTGTGQFLYPGAAGYRQGSFNGTGDYYGNRGNYGYGHRGGYYNNGYLNQYLVFGSFFPFFGGYGYGGLGGYGYDGLNSFGDAALNPQFTPGYGVNGPANDGTAEVPPANATTQPDFTPPTPPAEVGPENPAAQSRQSPAANGPDDLVGAVQNELTKRGYFGGKADSIYGADTRAAIQRFQADQGLPTTGKVNEATLHALQLD